MIVQFVGETDIDKMRDKLEQVVEDTITKVEVEQGITINGCKVHSAEISFRIDVEGMDEPQAMSVEHNGTTEPFRWIIDGGTEYSNEDESYYDDWSKGIAKGEEHIFEEIESVFEDTQLTKDLTDSEKYGNLNKDVYFHAEGFKVVRVYQDGKLIQEYSLKPLEEGADE